jgi:benzoylformate decarboxylase
VLVLRNEEYAILKWFSMLEDVSGAPGLDLPKLDVSGVAEGYGLRARRVENRDELTSALRDAIASKQPEVVEVQVAPGMTLG